MDVVARTHGVKFSQDSGIFVLSALHIPTKPIDKVSAQVQRTTKTSVHKSQRQVKRDMTRGQFSIHLGVGRTPIKGIRKESNPSNKISYSKMNKVLVNLSVLDISRPMEMVSLLAF